MVDAVISFTTIPTDTGPEFTSGQTYPTYPQGIDSSEELYDELIVDRTFAGLVRTRSLVPPDNIKRVFNVTHPALKLEEANILRAFYRTYRDTYFVFRWKADNQDYNVKFISSPKITIIGGNWWRASVQLAEV